MLTFNNTHIFTGYLKQLLSTIAIPTMRIYPKVTDGTYCFAATDHVISSIEAKRDDDGKIIKGITIPYFKDNSLQIYKQDTEEWVTIEPTIGKALSGFFEPGITKVLKSPGSQYTTETHEYLGEFLRFLRDAHGVNLMSLYNCFSKRLCNKINLNITLNEQAKTIQFSSADPKFKIYMLPVKLFQNYTIATDCEQGIEVCCGFYDKSLDQSPKGSDLLKNTYIKYANTNFNQPVLYNKLMTCVDTENDSVKDFNEPVASPKITHWDIAEKEHNLCMFIKVPINHTRTIAILEGDFLNYNDKVAKFDLASDKNNALKLSYTNNHLIWNFENSNDNILNFKPIAQLELLTVNTEDSYPFADRLIEYLLGNAVTPLDMIPDNIERVQEVQKNVMYKAALPGIWDNSIRLRIYDFFMNNSQDSKMLPGQYPKISSTLRNNTCLQDILGFVDKDVEKYYAKLDSQGRVVETLEAVNIYNNLYERTK